MQNIIERRGVRQFVKFGLVGVSSTAIDWGIFYVLYLVFGIYYLAAKMISFSVSVVNSFVWNRRWTFRSNDPRRLHEFLKFLVVSVVGLSANTLIMYIAVDEYHFRKIFGLMVATLVVTLWNFTANKFYTFKRVAG